MKLEMDANSQLGVVLNTLANGSSVITDQISQHNGRVRQGTPAQSWVTTKEEGVPQYVTTAPTTDPASRTGRKETAAEKSKQKERGNI